MDGHATTQRAAHDVNVVEAHGAEDGDDVGGHPLVVVRVGRLGLVGAAVAPQIDADRVEGACGGEAAGDGIEEPGAEAVGMEQHERAGIRSTAPVEDGDRQAVVRDGELTGRSAQVVFFARLGATRGGSLGILG